MEIFKTKLGGEEMMAVRLVHRKGHMQEYVARLIGPDLGDGFRREYADPISDDKTLSKRGTVVYAIKVSDLPALLEVQESASSVHSRKDQPFHVFVMPTGSYENVPFLEISHYIPKEYPGKKFRITQVSGVTVSLPVDTDSIDRPQGRCS